MPGKLTFKIEGLKKFENQLLSLAADLGPRKARTAVGPAMKAAMAPVLKAVQVNTPIETGALLRSVASRGGGPTRFELRRNRNYIYNQRVGYFWRGKSRSQRKKAIAHEYGTKYVPERAMLRNALERNIKRVTRTLGEQLGLAISKRATKFNRTGK